MQKLARLRSPVLRAVTPLLALLVAVPLFPLIPAAPAAAQELGPPPPIELDRTPAPAPGGEYGLAAEVELPLLDLDSLYEGEAMPDLLSAPELESATLESEFETTYKYGDGLADTHGSEVAQFFDGTTHVAKVGVAPLNFFDSEGVLHPIDTSLVPAAGGFENAAGPYDVFFPTLPSSATPIVLSLDGKQLLFVPSGISSSVNLDVTGTSAAYSGAKPDTDIVYSVAPATLKEDIILQTPDASPTIAFDITTVGLDLAQQADGSVAVLDGLDEVARIGAPIVHDSNVDPDYGEGVEGPVTQTLAAGTGPNQYVLTIAVDPAWFADPARVFPVTIDPGAKTTFAGRDTFVFGGDPGRNYGGWQKLRIGNRGVGNNRSMLGFNLSALKGVTNNQDRKVYEALLRMYNYHSKSAAPTTEWVRRITGGDWSEPTATWNNKPGIAPTGDPASVGRNRCGANHGCPGWHRWDAWRMFEGFIQGLYPNDGVAITGDDFKKFYSSEGSSTARPHVVITFNDPPPAPNPISPLEAEVLQTESPTLEIEKQDRLIKDKNGDDVYIRYQVSKSPDFSGANMVVDSGWLERTFKWPVPGGKLLDGQQYHWRVLTSDLIMMEGRDDTPHEQISPTMSFHVSLDKWGSDDRWPMWKQSIGNGISLEVNQATGNLFLDYPLDALATSAGPLNVRLTNNSQKGVDNDIPGGWNLSAGPGEDGHELPFRLREPRYGGVIIRFANGKRLHFPELAGRTFGSIGAGVGTVRKSADEQNPTWTYRTPNGGFYVFDSAGVLTEAKPSTGDWSKPGFAYTFDADRRLKSVTDPDSRSITVAYGTPTVITAWDGRQWSISSDGGVGWVQDPAGATVGFNYDAGGNLAGVTDGEGLTTSITHQPAPDARPLTSTITLPGQQHPTSFLYLGDWTGKVISWMDVVGPRGPETANAWDHLTRTWFNNAGLAIGIVGPTEVGGQWPVTVQLWDENGNLRCRRGPAANAARYGCADPNDLGRTWNHAWQPIATRDGLQSEYYYDDEPPFSIVREVGPDPHEGAGQRAVTTYSYDEEAAGQSAWDELYAEYYPNRNQVGLPVGAGMYAAMNVDWQQGSPQELGAQTDNWSLRLTGKLHVPSKQKYRFRAQTYPNDGVRLIVGKKLFLDCWQNAEDCPDESEERWLWPGEKDFVLEYVDRGEKARLRLRWDQGFTNVFQDLPVSLLDPNLGLLTSRSDPLGVTTYSYQGEGKPRGRVTAETRGTRTTSYAYDDFGQLVAETDALGHTTTYDYDKGCLKKLTDRTGAVTEYTCSAAGDTLQEKTIVREVTDPATGEVIQPSQQRITNYAYDALGRETRRESLGDRPAVATGSIENGEQNAVGFSVERSGNLAASLDWDPLRAFSEETLTGALAESQAASHDVALQGEGIIEAAVDWQPGTMSKPETFTGFVPEGGSVEETIDVTATDTDITADLDWAKQADTFAFEGSTGSPGPQAAGICQHCIQVSAPGTIRATLDWDQSLANLDLRLVKTGTGTVAQEASATEKPEHLEFEVEPDKLGEYSFVVDTAYPFVVDYTITGDYPTLPNLDLELRDPTNAVVASAASSGNPESLSFSPTTTGTHTFRITNAEGLGTTYDLDTEYPVVAKAPMALRILDDDGIEVASTLFSQSARSASYEASSPGGTYTLEVENGSSVIDVPGYSLEVATTLTKSTTEQGSLAESESVSYPLEAEDEGAIRAYLDWEQGTTIDDLDEATRVAGGSAQSYQVNVTATDAPITASVDWDSDLRPFSHSGTLNELGKPGSSATYEIEVDMSSGSPGTIEAELDWNQTLTSNLDLELIDPNGEVVDSTPLSTARPERVEWQVAGPADAGTYTLRVTNQSISDITSYTLEGSFPDFADLDLEVLDPGSQVVASASTSSRPEDLTYQPATTGWHTVKVVSSDIAADFDLAATYPISAYADMELRLLDPSGDVVETATAGRPVSIAHTAPRKSTYSVEVENASPDIDVPSYTLDMRAPARTLVADLDLTLLDGGGQVVAQAPDGRPEELSAQVSPGDYTLRIAANSERAVWHLDYSFPDWEWQNIEYDDAGRAEWTEDRDGRTIFDYDPTGRLWKEHLPDPDGGGPATAPVVEHGYDADGNEIRTVDARGRAWEKDYDALGRMIAERDPFCADGSPDPTQCAETTTSYELGRTNALGQLLGTRTIVEDAHATTTITNFDVLGRKTAERSGGMLEYAWFYDAVGNITTEGQATAGAPEAGTESFYTSRQYNLHGEVTREALGARPSGVEHATTFTYDNGGRLKTADGPRSDVDDGTTYAYDHEGRVTSVEILAETTTYAYDDAGELVRHEDPEGRVRTFSYDAYGREHTATDARGTTTTTYDHAGRVKRVALANGDLRTFSYDALGRQTRRYGHQAGVITRDERYAHDAGGNVERAAVVDPQGAETHAVGAIYDPAGRISSVSVNDTEETTFTYDKGRLASRTDPSGQTAFAYHPQGSTHEGLLASVIAFGAETLYTYDPAGRPETRTDPTGLVTTRTYDDHGRLDAQETLRGTGVVASFDLGRDEAGNVTAKEVALEGAPASEQGTWGYGYDGAGRMKSATDPGGTTTTYAYDGAGNRTERKVGGQAKEVTSYDQAGHPVRTTKGGTEVASYRTDATGSVIEATRDGAATVFTYDAFGRTASALTPQGEVSYAYDALDRTVSRTLGEETTSFSYSGTSHELAKEQGQEATLYATSPSGPLARKVGDAPAEWLLRDLHTDLSATVSLGGAVTASFTYSPWGEPRTSSGDSTLGFQADPTDPETGLVDMGTRLYDALLGRFTSRDILFGDPLTPLSLNQFAYTQGSPIGYHDPTGMVRTSGGGSCACTDEELARIRRGERSHGRASRESILLPGYVPHPTIPHPPRPEVRTRVADPIEGGIYAPAIPLKGPGRATPIAGEPGFPWEDRPAAVDSPFGDPLPEPTPEPEVLPERESSPGASLLCTGAFLVLSGVGLGLGSFIADLTLSSTVCGVL